MPKEEQEFKSADLIGAWHQVSEEEPAIWEKILSRDPETGNMTRLVKFLPGLRTSETLMHSCWEEVYILEGFLTDIRKNITMGEGYYACRPIGMEHGPYCAPLGCTMLEIRYQ